MFLRKKNISWISYPERALHESRIVLKLILNPIPAGGGGQFDPPPCRFFT